MWRVHKGFLVGLLPSKSHCPPPGGGSVEGCSQTSYFDQSADMLRRSYRGMVFHDCADVDAGNDVAVSGPDRISSNSSSWYLPVFNQDLIA